MDESRPEYYDRFEQKGERRARNMIICPQPGYIIDYVHRDWDQMSDGIDDKMFDGSDIINPGLRSGRHPDLPCRLCNLHSVKPVHFYCNEFVIINCPICNVKLVIIQPHTMNISESVLGKMMSKLNGMYGRHQITHWSDCNHYNIHVFLTEQDKRAFKLCHNLEETG